MINKDLITIIVNYVGFHKDLDFEISFFEKHLDKVNWVGLSGNSNIPVTFFEKYLDI
jgi:DNA mismatch repair protein MutH